MRTSLKPVLVVGTLLSLLFVSAPVAGAQTDPVATLGSGLADEDRTDPVHLHPEPAPLGTETWPSFNESNGCEALRTSAPLASQQGWLPDSEAIRGPYGDYFGRTVGAIRSQLVDWTVPMSDGVVQKVHSRALPAFQQVAANLSAEAVKGNYYEARAEATWGFAARTVSGSYGFSRHSFGFAIDINSDTNPYRSDETLITDMPDWYVQAWKDAGFCWGGDWQDFKDPMHFSWQGPSSTPGYGEPLESFPPLTAAEPFTDLAYTKSTFFSGLPDTHRVADVSGTGAADPVYLSQQDDGVRIAFASARSGYIECSIGQGLATGETLDRTVVLGDFSGIRRTDVAFMDEAGSTVEIRLYRLSGGWEELEVIETTIPSRPGSDYVVADHNWDGTPDLLAIEHAPGSTNVVVWDGKTGFTSKLESFAGAFGDTTGWRFGAGDFDLDDRPDLYAVEPKAGGATVHVMGIESVDTNIDLPEGAGLYVGEYDGDGRADIWVNDGGVLNAYLGNTGTGTNLWFFDREYECPDDWGPFEWEGWFSDDDGSIFEDDINWIASKGISLGCNPPANTMYCPDASVSRGQMAAFLARALDLPAGPDKFVDDDDSILEDAINSVAAAGITIGCNPPTNDRYCPGDLVKRDQMAAFLVRALDLTEQLDDPFTDDAGTFEDDIEKLAASGITLGCNPPDNTKYCPGLNITRAQMAAFLHRALLDLLGP